jgi:hypothetical protein
VSQLPRRHKSELFTTTFWRFPREFWTPREQLCRGDLSVSFRQIAQHAIIGSCPQRPVCGRSVAVCLQPCGTAVAHRRRSGLWKDPRWWRLTGLRHRARRSAASQAPWQRTIRQPLLGWGHFHGKIAEFTVQLRTDDVLLSRESSCPAGVYLAWTAKVSLPFARNSVDSRRQRGTLMVVLGPDLTWRAGSSQSS